MKWLKKWLYLIILLGMGIVYLVYVDEWQVYAGSLKRIKNWYDDSGMGNRRTIETWIALLTGGDEMPLEQYGDGSGGSDEPEDGEDSAFIGEKDMPSQGESAENIFEGNELSGEPGQEGVAAGELDTSANGEETKESGGDMPEEGTEPTEPVFVAVEDDYFADAVFIGDSRTVGLFKYGGLEEVATFYASTGLTVYKMFDSDIVSVPGEKKKITVEEALQQNTFSKIYLMIGINEMGIGTADSFLAKYYEAVVHLQELQPDAIIYLQGIMKVTSDRSAQGDYINNSGIDVRNVGIEALADNQKTFYLDVNPFLCDETGGLEPSYTFDGVHLKAKYYEIWKEYLKTHAISS